MDDQNQTPPPYSGPAAAEEATANPTPTEPTAAPGKSSSAALIIGIVILLLAVAGYAAYHFWPELRSATEGDAAQENGDTSPVATVNGESISRAQYDETLARVTAQAEQQGLDISDPQVASEIQNQVIDSLVNNLLLVQAATAADISPTEAAIDEQMASIITQFGGEEALQTQMESLDLTEAEVRADISEQLAVEELVTGEVDLESITVTDAEVQEFYDTIAAQNPDLVPPLADVSEQIEAQLQAEKEQVLIDELLASLRAQADIEILI